MQVTVRQIGNSRGVILPSKLLAEACIGERVDIRMEAGRLIIEPIAAPRQGWFTAFKAEEADENAWNAVADMASEQEDWEW